MDGRFAQWKKQLAYAVLMGMVGVLCFFLLEEIEERYGLNGLFALRGATPAPDDVVVIAIDQASALKFGYPAQVSRWPRAVHADLIEKLTAAGANVIAIDLVFSACRQDADDARLADAIRQAGNVVLVEGFFPVTLLNGDIETGQSLSEHTVLSGHVRQEICPVFVEASRAQSPFILPSSKDGRVTHHWHFVSIAEETASLPIETQPMPILPTLAMQVFALPLHTEFVQLLQKASPSLAGEFSTAPWDIEEMMLLLLKRFTEQPILAQQLKQLLIQDGAPDSRQKKIIGALIDLYTITEKRYLNFYGPPRSIPTFSYHQILDSSENKNLPDLQGKAAFIGISAQSQTEQDFVKAGDEYVTPFPGLDGTKMSGVEIAATVFANLLDDSSIKPLPAWMAAALLLILGMTVSLIFFRISNAMTIMLGIILIAAYWAITYHQFVQFHRWLPLVTPTALVLSSMLMAILMKSLQKFRRFLSVFKVVLPERLEADVRNSHTLIGITDESAEGICMFTDIQGYSAIAEKMDPQDLRQMMSEYFAVLKAQITRYGGEIISAQGDEVHAIWRTQPANECKQKMQACLACFGITEAVGRHQVNPTLPQLYTRIGLHYGTMSLRLLQASQSHAISATGDTVNIAKRIESANKTFGTQLLLSAGLADDLENFLLRPLGEFILPGMSRKLALLELVALKRHADEKQHWICDTFALGLTAYQAGQVDIAARHFLDILDIHPGDGPAKFYLAHCNEAARAQISILHP